MARGVWELRESFAPSSLGRKAQNRFTDFYDFERVRLAVQLLVVDTSCLAEVCGCLLLYHHLSMRTYRITRVTR